MRFKFRNTILFLLAALYFTGCHKNEPTPQSFLVNAHEVSQNGCLNIQMLLERMKTFPPQTVGRKVSTYVEVSGETVKPNSVLLMTHGNFVFEERPFSDLKNLMPVQRAISANQFLCSRVSLINEAGSETPFQVESYTESSLKMISDDEDKKEVELLFTPPQTLTIRSTYSTKDYCDNEAEAMTHTEIIFRWGLSDISTLIPAERVNTAMLRSLVQSSDNPPSEIVDASQSVEESVEVSISSLKAIRSAAIKTEVLGCFPTDPQPTPTPMP